MLTEQAIVCQHAIVLHEIDTRARVQVRHGMRSWTQCTTEYSQSPEVMSLHRIPIERPGKACHEFGHVHILAIAHPLP